MVHTSILLILIISNHIMEYKVTDLLGREFKVGEIVANVTSCTSTGQLRRSIVKSISLEDSPYIGERAKGIKYATVRLRSLIPNQRRYKTIPSPTNPGNFEYVHETRVTSGNTEQRAIPMDTSVCKFNLIRLGTFDECFDAQEREQIFSTKMKLNYVTI